MIAIDRKTGKVIGQVIGDEAPPAWGEVKILTANGVLVVPAKDVKIEQTH